MMSIDAVLLAWFGAAAVLYLVMLYDCYRYPVCGRCGDNLRAKRRLLSSFAWCGVHGPFWPGAPSRSLPAGASGP